MTDETRPTEGRTPSDNSGPQGRPEFLPVGGQPEPSGGPSGNPWGDPSGSGTPSHDNAFGAPRADTRAYEAPTFGRARPSNGPAVTALRSTRPVVTARISGPAARDPLSSRPVVTACISGPVMGICFPVARW